MEEKALELCPHCNQPLPKEEDTCPSCGAPVRPMANPFASLPDPLDGTLPEPPPTPPQAQPAPVVVPSFAPASPSTPAKAKPQRDESSRNLWIGLGAMGCLAVVGCIALFAGVFLLMRDQNLDINSLLSNLENQAVQPTQSDFSRPGDFFGSQASPTPPPAATFPPAPLPGSETIVLYSDFSNDEHGWYVGETDLSIREVRNEKYVSTVFDPGYWAWSDVPLDGVFRAISFEAAAVGNPANGFLGVLCLYQDEDNYYYAAIDTDYQEYYLGRVAAGFEQAVLPEEWMDATALDPDPAATNHYMLICDPLEIRLLVNDVEEIRVSLPAEASYGIMSLFIQTWSDLEGQYKVEMDNITVYSP